jgi:hypothetical protein
MINNRHTKILTSSELSRQASKAVDDFQAKISIKPAMDISLCFHRSQAAVQPALFRSCRAPIFSEIHDNCLTIHLCEEDLVGIPQLALQGWLDLELSGWVVKRQPELYRFNFRKDILPLFTVSGSAVQFTRHLVAHLEAGLKKYLATRMIIDMGHGLPQLYYYFLQINLSHSDRESYQRLVPHHWIRADFLCKKFKVYLCVALLADQGFSIALKSYWWDCHSYILPQDRALLEKLAAVPSLYAERSYSYKLVQIFAAVKRHLLVD